MGITLFLIGWTLFVFVGGAAFGGVVVLEHMEEAEKDKGRDA